MRSIALVSLFVLALGTGCASQRTRTTYVARAPSYSARTTYSSYSSRAPRSTQRVVRPRAAAPVYGTSYGRRVTYASAVPPPPPPPPLYSTYRSPAPVRTVVYSATTQAPRRTVRPARRQAPTRSVVTRARAPSRRTSHDGCVSFVGGFAGVLPASSCST